MFSNIGKKIMNLATVTCVIGIAVSVIAGLAVIGDDFLTGFLTMVLGSLASWIGSFVLFGLGRLIDNTSMICYAMGHPTEPDFVPESYREAPGETVPPAQTYSIQQSASYTPKPLTCSSSGQLRATVPNGHWKCKCGIVHAPYVTSCPCGANKRDQRK